MKKICFIAFYLSVAYQTYAQINTVFHIGKWKTNDVGLKNIIFDQEGFVTIISESGSAGGQEYLANGKKLSMRYRISYVKRPYLIDWIVIEKRTNKTFVSKGIFEIIDKNTMKLRISFDGNERPKNFNMGNVEIEEILILKRVI